MDVSEMLKNDNTFVLGGSSSSPNERWRTALHLHTKMDNSMVATEGVSVWKKSEDLLVPFVSSGRADCQLLFVLRVSALFALYIQFSVNWHGFWIIQFFSSRAVFILRRGENEFISAFLFR